MRADRLVSIIMLLQSRGKLTTQSLATTLDVSRRTILRDVEALSMAGIPIYTDGGHGGGVALDERYRTNLTGLKEAEIQALFITGNHQLLQEIGLGEAAESTQRKLSAALPTQHQLSVEHIRQRIHIDPLWWWHDAKPLAFWSDLQTAVYQDQCIQVVYEKYNGEISQRMLEPYSLVAKSSHWYLVAKEVVSKEAGTEVTGKADKAVAQNWAAWRTFRVSRLRELQRLENRFQRDPRFDLAAYWTEHLNEFTNTFSEYVFTLRIHPDRVNMARWLTPGRNQLLDTDPHLDVGPSLDIDAASWPTMRFQIENVELAKMLVFGLGTQCEVVEPVALKEAVQLACTELQITLAGY